jgi:hypothetical protein
MDFDPMDNAFAQGKPAEREVREDALPRSDHYVVEFQGGKGGFQGDEVIPNARMSAKVLHGPEGTGDKVIFGTLKFQPSRFAWDKEQNQTPLPAEKYAEVCQKLADTHLRIGKVLGLTNSRPVKPYTEESLSEFAQQFAGKKAVIAVSYLAARGDYGASNLFIWGSIAALDERVIGKTGKDKGKDLGSALEVALDGLKKEAARATAKAGGGKGRTAGGFAGPNLTA